MSTARRARGRGSVVWKRDQWVGRWKDGGVRRSKALGIRDKRARKQARAALDAHLDSLAGDASVPVGRTMTLDDYLADVYLAEYRPNVSEATYTRTAYDLRRAILRWPDVPMSAISRREVASFVRALRKDGAGTGRPLSEDSIRRALTCLGSVWASALEDDVVESNVFRGARQRRVRLKPPKTRELPEVLTREQLDVVLALLPDDVRECVTLIVDTGVRREQGRALRWAQVDADHSRIWPTPQKHGKQAEIPTTDVVRALLRRRRLATVGDLVFPSVTLGRLRTQWSKARAAAGHPWLRLHDLRHLFLARVAQVAPRSVAAGLAGHRSTAMVDRYYGGHHRNEQAEAAIERMQGRRPG